MRFFVRKEKTIGLCAQMITILHRREYVEDHRGFVHLVAVARMPPLLLLDCRLKVVFASYLSKTTAEEFSEPLRLSPLEHLQGGVHHQP